MSSSQYYVELVFFGDRCAIVRRISLMRWRLIRYSGIHLTEGRIYFFYDLENIKYFWTQVRRDSESYNLPFAIEKLQICLKE